MANKKRTIYLFICMHMQEYGYFLLLLLLFVVVDYGKIFAYYKLTQRHSPEKYNEYDCVFLRLCFFNTHSSICVFVFFLIEDFYIHTFYFCIICRFCFVGYFFSLGFLCKGRVMDGGGGGEGVKDEYLKKSQEAPSVWPVRRQ